MTVRNKPGFVPGCSRAPEARAPAASCRGPRSMASRPPTFPDTPDSAAATPLRASAARAPGQRVEFPEAARSERPREEEGSLHGLGEIRLQDLGRHRAGEFRHDHTVAIQKIGLRHAADAVRDGSLPLLIEQRGIRRSALAQKGIDLVFVVIEDHADELYARKHSRVLYQHRMLLVTGNAPRRPEVDDGGLASQRGEIDRLAGTDGLQRERRRGLAHQRRPNLGRIFSQPDEKTGDLCQCDRGADDEDRAVHTRCPDPERSEGEGPAESAGAFDSSGSGFLATLGINAIKPPTPIRRTAIQIHDTIGVISIITETVWLFGSMFMIER